MPDGRDRDSRRSPHEVLLRQLGNEPVPIPPDLADRRLRTLLETVTAKAVEKRNVSAAGLMEALGALSELAAPAGALEVERRQLTILSVRLTLAAEPGHLSDIEALDELLHAQQALLAEAARRDGGHVVGTLADRLVVAFGYPQADEHDARRAVRTAERLRGDVAAATLRHRATHGADLEIRIGVHTGLVVTREQRVGGIFGLRDLSGLTPQTAAALEARAAPGEVLLSADTVACCAANCVRGATCQHRDPPERGCLSPDWRSTRRGAGSGMSLHRSPPRAGGSRSPLGGGQGRSRGGSAGGG
jgi:class 3 adenylate cyclase